MIVTKHVADAIIKSNGRFRSQGRIATAVMVTEFEHTNGGTHYGITLAGRTNQLLHSTYARNPRIYWRAPQEGLEP